MSEMTSVLEANKGGEWRGSDELLPLVYEDLRRLATARMARELSGHTLQPTALVHEAWLRLSANGKPHWQNRAHFFAAAAEAMRRILIENARRKSAVKHGGNLSRLDIDSVDLADTSADEKVLLIDEALQRLENEDPQRAQIVVLKFFGELSNREIAESLDIGERTVDRQWAYAKACLFRIIRTQLA